MSHPEWLKFRKGLRLSVQNKNLSQALVGSRIQLGFRNAGGHTLPSDQVSTSVAVSLLSCCHFPCCITLPQGTWICGFPMPGKGCGIKHSPTPCSHQLSLLCVGKKRNELCENHNLGNAAKKKSQQKELEVTGEPRAGGAGAVPQQDGQTHRLGCAKAGVCPPVLPCAGFPLWVLGSASPHSLPSTLQMFSRSPNSHSFSWWDLSQEGRRFGL